MLQCLLIASVKNIQNHSKKPGNKFFRAKQRQEQNSKALSIPSPTWRSRKSWFHFRVQEEVGFCRVFAKK